MWKRKREHRERSRSWASTPSMCLHIWWALLQGPCAPGASKLCLCKCADALTLLLLLSPPLFAGSPPSFGFPVFLPLNPLLSSSFSRLPPFSPLHSSSLSEPRAQPGGSVLMHHGTFCSFESQCDQALCSDRTATSLSIAAGTVLCQGLFKVRMEAMGGGLEKERREKSMEKRWGASKQDSASHRYHLRWK